MIILDIDNTIAHDAWRVERINHGKLDPYHDYHIASRLDECGNHHLFQTDEPIMIFTSRPVVYRELTHEWLEKHGVRYERMFMRPRLNVMGSVELKRHMLQLLRTIYPDRPIKMAYDDRTDIIAMYEEQGIPATHIQLAEVNYGKGA